jgi:hypothetical protein
MRLRSSFDLLSATFRALQFALGDAISGVLTRSLRIMAEAVATTIKWVKANTGLVAGIFRVAKPLIGIGVAAALLGQVAPVLSQAFAGLSAVVGALAIPVNLAKVALTALAATLAFITTPVGAVVAALLTVGAAFVHVSGLGGDVVRFLGRKFQELSKIAGQTFDAIGDALAGGDIIAAANVLWAGLKLAWLTGTKELHASWLNFKDLAARTMIELSAQVQTTWANMTAGLRSVWLEFQRWFLDAWDVTVHFFARIGQTEGVRAQLEKQLIDRVGAREIDAKKDKGRIEADKLKALAEIESARAQSQVDQDETINGALAEATAGFDDANKKFADAIKKAREARARGLGGRLADDQFLPGIFADIGEAAKGFTRSTFSGALSPQVFGAPAKDELPKLTKQQLKEIRLARQRLEAIERNTKRQRFLAGNR